MKTMELNNLEITEQPEGFRFTSIRELVNRTLNQNFGTHITRDKVSSGFKELDKALGGFQKGHLYTIAVKPGMGKTAFLLSLTNNMAIKDNYSVAIFSSERSNQKMTNRLIETETGMSLNQLQSGSFKESERDHLLSMLSNIAKAKIFMDDTPALSTSLFAKKIRELKQRQHIDLVIVDYLELLTIGIGQKTDRPAQLGSIVKELRDIASALEIPVLLFSQSAGYTNGYPGAIRPSIKALPAFLKDHSDVCMLLHRNIVFEAKSQSSAKHAVELYVIPGDNTDKEIIVPLGFIESIAKFTDFS
ncbi:MAG: hypothetical protein EA394_11510 [Bacteroidia bacterium]|nr:MAG: hypothetical protein EA394_11510 [Bacteroidia bacterium]